MAGWGSFFAVSMAFLVAFSRFSQIVFETVGVNASERLSDASPIRNA